MTDTSLSRPHTCPTTPIRRIHEAMAAIPYWFTALVLRLPIAAVFWRSGQTKVDGFHLSSSAIDLFKDEYKLPLIDPTVAAYLSAIAEHLFPVLLVIGLATRFSAFALLIMTLVIEILVYPDAWPTHGTWAACFLVLMVQGPGKVSIDHLIAQRFCK
jgi:putative oxidoreductase